MQDFFEPLPPNAPPEKIPTLVTSSAQDISPGPAAYKTNSDLISQIPKIPIHTKPAETVYVNNAPYTNIPSTIGTGPKYSFKGRLPEFQDEQTPGPDYAGEPLGSNAPKVYIHTKGGDKKIEQSPGPGQYQVNSNLCNPKHGISFHGPRDRTMNTYSESPGPGAYDARVPNTCRCPPIGRRDYIQHVDENPGPGAYMSPRFGPNKSKGYIGRQTSVSYDHLGPGPAAYNTSSGILSSVPRICIHTKPRDHIEPAGVPYQDTRPKFTGPKYSMRFKHYNNTFENTPGPDYAPEAFGKASPRVAIHGVTRNRREEITPGPGAYVTEKSFGSEARKSTFHGPKSRAIPLGEDNPSPADYSVDFSKVNPSAPSYSIGKKTGGEKREKTGEYVNLGSTLKGPTYTMKARPSLDVAYV